MTINNHPTRANVQVKLLGSTKLSDCQIHPVFGWSVLGVIKTMEYQCPGFEKELLRMEKYCYLDIRVDGKVIPIDQVFNDMQSDYVLTIESLVRVEGNLGGALLKGALFVGLGLFTGMPLVGALILGAKTVFSSFFKVPKQKDKEDEEKSSALFSNAVNADNIEGGIVPIAYGTPFVGTAVLSGKITPESTKV